MLGIAPTLVSGEPFVSIAVPKESTTAADPSMMEKMRNIVTDFNNRYALLSSNAYGAKIFRTGDSALMQDYGNTLARMTKVKKGIDYTLNNYSALKSFIGLGVIPLVPIAVVAGLTAIVLTALTTMNTFMKRAGIKELQAENPKLSITQAAAVYDSQSQSVFGKAVDLAQLALWLGGAFLLWKVFGKK